MTFIDNFAQFNMHLTVFQDPSKCAFLNGYATYTRAFSFYDLVRASAPWFVRCDTHANMQVLTNYTGPLAQAVFQNMKPLSPLLG